MAPPDAGRILGEQVEDLRGRLAARERRIRMLESSSEASEDVLTEWQAKYDRLWEAHRKLQKTNHSLEDKLLRVVDKFEADRNQMTRDLASQTQKLVQAKLTVQQLRDQIGELQSDLQLAITLLQNKPSSYLPQRMGGLPLDVQGRVRSYVAEKQQQQLQQQHHQATSARKITVPIMDDVEQANVGEDERVSAAILAKVLEERAKERRRDRKFCIDVGTQTHSWLFPDNKLHPAPSSSAAQSASAASAASAAASAAANPSQDPNEAREDAANARVAAANNGLPLSQPKQKKRQQKGGGGGVAPVSSGGHPETTEVIQILRSISMDDTIRKYSDSGGGGIEEADSTASPGNILFQASVIRPPPASMAAAASASASASASSPSSSNGQGRSCAGGGDDASSSRAKNEPSSTQESSKVAADTGGAKKKRPMPRSATFSSKQTDL